MKRLTIWLVLATGWLTHASPAWAGWCDLFQRVHTDARRSNCWPDPFRGMDQELTRAPFQAFIASGWRLENTLVEQLFTENNELTNAGKLKLRQILTQVPPQRRAVYVLQGTSPEVTEKRVDAVQRAVADMIPDGPMPPVLVTGWEPRGGTGDYLNVVIQKHRQSLPAPILPDAGGGTAGGGSEGSSN